MCDNKSKEKSENKPKERRDSNSDKMPQNKGFSIGESVQEQERLRKAAEIAPKPPKPKKDSDKE